MSFLYEFALAYAVVASGLIYVVATGPTLLRRKVLAGTFGVAALSILPGIAAKDAIERKVAQADIETYRLEAWAHFEKRCAADAGEKIYRTIENVKGLLLLKPRQQATDVQLRDQYWRGDPYGHDSIVPDSEIRNFIGYLNDRNVATKTPTSRPGYQFVETKNPGGGYTRFQLSATGQEFKQTSVAEPESLYGITWTDISTDEDRKYWVAGGRLQVVKLATNEVLGERIGFLLEPGFGSIAGGRVPWGHARFMSSNRAACPPFQPRSLVPINRLFVEKVLVPARRGSNGN